MLTYQIDKAAQQKLTAEMRDISPVLAEIAPTLQILQEVINQHAAAISTPTINDFRNQLQDLILKATGLTRAISEDVKKLASVSDQTAKHLASIEEHFGAVLRGVEKETPEVVAATQEAQV